MVQVRAGCFSIIYYHSFARDVFKTKYIYYVLCSDDDDDDVDFGDCNIMYTVKTKPATMYAQICYVNQMSPLILHIFIDAVFIYLFDLFKVVLWLWLIFCFFFVLCVPEIFAFKLIAYCTIRNINCDLRSGKTNEFGCNDDYFGYVYIANNCSKWI